MAHGQLGPTARGERRRAASDGLAESRKMWPVGGPCQSAHFGLV